MFKKFLLIAGILAIMGGGVSVCSAGISFTVGTGNFYVSVGDYDYLPYAYDTNPGYQPPVVNFMDALGQYGQWTTDQYFGQVWQPYAAYGWRPYLYGHWIYTQQYGPYWQGYEPWAWIGYHYGDWAYTPRGWVWVPGYDWHPGRVVWARGVNTIGWMPLPPSGYDYSRGNIAYTGPNNQFTYNDNDFNDYDGDNYTYGGPYYDSRYRDMYYNPSYTNSAPNFWIFINAGSFNNDNYGDEYLGPDYTRYVFDRKQIKINNRPIQRNILERVIAAPIREVSVQEKQMQTDKRAIKVVIPSDQASIQEIRKNSAKVVRDVVAPGFAEKQKPMKGLNAKNKAAVDNVFKQQNVAPKTETIDSDKIVQQSKQDNQNNDQKRKQKAETVRAKSDQLEKQGKIKQKNGNQQNQNQQNQNTKADNRPNQMPIPNQQIPNQPNPNQPNPNQPNPRNRNQPGPNAPPPPNGPNVQPVPGDNTEPQNGSEVKPEDQPAVAQNEEEQANQDNNEKNGNAPSDSQLSSRVSTKLAKAGLAVQVHAKDGTITLSGKVNETKDEERAIQLARSVAGVEKVKSNITVSNSKKKAKPSEGTN